MASLKTILRKIRRELKVKEKVKDEIQADMRKATSLSKQAILLIHQKRLKEAGKILEKAREIISRLKELAETHPDIVYSGLYNIALQEYAEAKIFRALVEEGRFVTPEEIDVPSVDYVLGLADVIGEYRRLALDALRDGDVKKSEECLRIMDEIYTELMAMDEAYMLVPGLRRKCDVVRKVIETTRGDVTHEARRQSLEKYMKRLEKLERRFENLKKEDR
jgi:Predicted RNA-binding protein of the translin family